MFKYLFEMSELIIRLIYREKFSLKAQLHTLFFSDLLK